MCFSQVKKATRMKKIVNESLQINSTDICLQASIKGLLPWEEQKKTGFIVQTEVINQRVLNDL